MNGYGWGKKIMRDKKKFNIYIVAFTTRWNVFSEVYGERWCFYLRHENFYWWMNLAILFVINWERLRVDFYSIRPTYWMKHLNRAIWNIKEVELDRNRWFCFIKIDQSGWYIYFQITFVTLKSPKKRQQESTGKRGSVVSTESNLCLIFAFKVLMKI